MEQFFGLVNTFLQNHRDTWKRRLGVRTYKVSSSTHNDISEPIMIKEKVDI